MARTVRGCPTTQLQSESKDEPETILNTPQQEGDPDAAEGGNIANRPTKQQKITATRGTFKGMIELKKYSREEHDSMLMVQCQQMYELWNKTRLIKSEKTPESSRALEARVAMFQAKTNNSSNKSLFMDKPKANIRNDPALDRKVNGTRQSHTDT